MDNFNFVQLQDLSLAGSGVSLIDTSIVLKSFKLIDGITNVSMSMFGTLGMAVIEPDTSREENISFTGVTQNVTDGTATLTGVTRGLDFKTPYTAVAGNRKAHAGGSIMRISNTAPFYDQIAVKSNDETITGTYSFVTPNVPRLNTAHTYIAGQEEYLVTKRYADSLTFAGAPDASTTTKGIVEIATLSEVDSGTATGGTGAVLVPPNSYFQEGCFNIQLYIAGENIDASVIPQAVYLKESDGRVYKTIVGDSESTYSFIGFATAGQNITTGNSIKIQTDGLVSGFTTLILGKDYFLTATAGQIDFNPGTNVYQVGRAVTTTKLLIKNGKKIRQFIQTFNATTAVNIVFGFSPVKIRIHALNGVNQWSNGGWNINNGNNCVFYGGATGFSNTNSWNTTDGAGNLHTGQITSITTSGFTLSNIKGGAPADVYLYIEVEGN